MKYIFWIYFYGKSQTIILIKKLKKALEQKEEFDVKKNKIFIIISNFNAKD